MTPHRLRSSTGWRRRLVDGYRPDGWDQDDLVFAAVLDEWVVGFGHIGLENPDDHGNRSRGELMRR